MEETVKFNWWKPIEKFLKGLGGGVLVVAIPTVLSYAIENIPNLFVSLGLGNTIWLSITLALLTAVLNAWKHRAKI